VIGDNLYAIFWGSPTWNIKRMNLIGSKWYAPVNSHRYLEWISLASVTGTGIKIKTTLTNPLNNTYQLYIWTTKTESRVYSWSGTNNLFVNGNILQHGEGSSANFTTMWLSTTEWQNLTKITCAWISKYLNVVPTISSGFLYFNKSVYLIWRTQCSLDKIIDNSIELSVDSNGEAIIPLSTLSSTFWWSVPNTVFLKYVLTPSLDQLNTPNITNVEIFNN
jgi:hypothetical protein